MLKESKKKQVELILTIYVNLISKIYHHVINIKYDGIFFFTKSEISRCIYAE